MPHHTFAAQVNLTPSIRFWTQTARPSMLRKHSPPAQLPVAGTRMLLHEAVLCLGPAAVAVLIASTFLSSLRAPASVIAAPPAWGLVVAISGILYNSEKDHGARKCPPVARVEFCRLYRIYFLSFIYFEARRTPCRQHRKAQLPRVHAAALAGDVLAAGGRPPRPGASHILAFCAAAGHHR